jgi:hypothetical protein
MIVSGTLPRHGMVYDNFRFKIEPVTGDGTTGTMHAARNDGRRYVAVRLKVFKV